MNTDFDLPDSTDWHSTSIPAFEALEAALRCEVCKEFLDSPVITPCSHTFCSRCIRRCISSDGRCPSCKTSCQSDKLLPNIAVREVVMRFQEARPKALEMARADNLSETHAQSGRKRKLEDTDIEAEEPARPTRSRPTRSSSRRNGAIDAPVEVLDSADDGDEDFLPEGMARCPICNDVMKAEQVFHHLDVCTGTGASTGRSARSKTKTTPGIEQPTSLPRRHKSPSPPPTRLSQFNYAMLKEGALRKKLQDLGIPNWGDKNLLKRRHVEWLNIYNSNCDAHESLRRSKGQLLKELSEWEHTQGGHANSKESRFMKKDFDGDGHAVKHKTEFDHLIARARAERTMPKAEDAAAAPNGEIVSQQRHATSTLQTSPTLHHGDNKGPGAPIAHSHACPTPHPPSKEQPYANNEAALSTIRAKVQQVNKTGSTLSTAAHKSPPPEDISDDEVGMQNPIGSPTRKLPMFKMPEQPVKDIDMSSAVQ